MSKKKRNKKHNPNKRAQAVFNNTRLWSWESMIEEDGTRISYGEAKIGFNWIPLSQKQVNAVVINNNNWTICCRAYCRNAATNEEWLETSIRTIIDVKINDLSNLYAEMRDEVIETLREADELNTIIDVGWILNSFGASSRIDSGFELAHQGEPSSERYEKYLQAQPLEESIEKLDGCLKHP